MSKVEVTNREVSMIFQMLLGFWLFVLDLMLVRRMGDREKDIEIMLLRQQLRIVERKQQARASPGAVGEIAIGCTDNTVARACDQLARTAIGNHVAVQT